MMDCTRCTEELTAFLDGELGPADAESVRSHINACASCSDEMRTLRDAADFVRSHKRELEVSPAAWRLVRARIAAPRESSRPSYSRARYRWRFALATVAVAAAVALGAFQYQQVQRRNLDHYIDQCIRSREAYAPDPPVFAEKEMYPRTEDQRPYNPFAEQENTLKDNPFRLEEP